MLHRGALSWSLLPGCRAVTDGGPLGGVGCGGGAHWPCWHCPLRCPLHCGFVSDCHLSLTAIVPERKAPMSQPAIV